MAAPQWHVLQWYWCMYVFLCLLFLLHTTPHNTHKQQSYNNNCQLGFWMETVLTWLIFSRITLSPWSQHHIFMKVDIEIEIEMNSKWWFRLLSPPPLVLGGIVSNCIPQTVIQVHAGAILLAHKWYFPWNINHTFEKTF